MSYSVQLLKKIIINEIDIKASLKLIKMRHDGALPVMFLGVPPISGSREKNNRWEVFELHILN